MEFLQNLTIFYFAADEHYTYVICADRTNRGGGVWVGSQKANEFFTSRCQIPLSLY